MIEKSKRPKQVSNQERKIPANIQELITRYDLDNTAVYEFLDYLVENYNNLENLEAEDRAELEELIKLGTSETWTEQSVTKKAYKPEDNNYIDDKYVIHSSNNEHESVYNKIEKLTTYSTTEAKTSETWIDRKADL